MLESRYGTMTNYARTWDVSQEERKECLQSCLNHMGQRIMHVLQLRYQYGFIDDVLKWRNKQIKRLTKNKEIRRGKSIQVN